jgi:hypothetical protein
MAGLGRKVFAVNEVLTAADVNGYLMDQAVMVFDDSAARSSAIATATEGMMSYTKDDNAVQVYDGTAWAAVDTTLSTINGTAVSYTLTSSTAVAYTFTVGAQYEAVSVICTASDTYRIIGNITAV